MGCRPRRPCGRSTGSGAARRTPANEPGGDDACPINPRTILEAMLFVGNRDNEPLSPRRAAELMRDVEADEIPSLVAELNRRYDGDGLPYHIVGEGDGYRLAALPRVPFVAEPLLRPGARGPLVAGGRRRAGVGGLSAAANGRADSSSPRPAEPPRLGPSGASRSVADRAARREAPHAALFHDRSLFAAVQSPVARRPAA